MIGGFIFVNLGKTGRLLFQVRRLLVSLFLIFMFYTIAKNVQHKSSFCGYVTDVRSTYIILKDVDSNLKVQLFYRKPISYGDNLCVKEVKPIRVEYLKMKGVFYSAKVEEYGETDVVKLNLLESIAVYLTKQSIKVKERIKMNLGEFLPSDILSLYYGMLLGNGAEDKELRQRLKGAGIGHIMAVSGYNITMFMSFLEMAWSKLKRGRAILFKIISAVFFLFLIGDEPSVVRAVLFFVVNISLEFSGFVEDRLDRFILCVVLFFCIKPFYLYSVGAYLSFGATFGIMFIFPILQGVARRIKVGKVKILAGLVENFLISLSAQIFTMPIIYFISGEFNIRSLLYNILVLPFVELFTTVGYISLPFIFISKDVAQLFALALGPVLSLIVLIVKL